MLVSLPNIVLLFPAIAILEGTGYMARAAFIMDRLVRKLGLHGKSFLPMLPGFGCCLHRCRSSDLSGSKGVPRLHRKVQRVRLPRPAHHVQTSGLTPQRTS